MRLRHVWFLWTGVTLVSACGHDWSTERDGGDPAEVWGGDDGGTTDQVGTDTGVEDGSVTDDAVPDEDATSWDGDTPSCTLPRTAEGLRALAWNLSPVLQRSDVGAPEGTHVVSVYSPTYARFAGREILAFGVALYCEPGGISVARDSIGWAERVGEAWVFRGYLLEPDPVACLRPPADWESGIVFQVNDPEFLVDGDVLRVFYTSARLTAAAMDCGSIGTAVFDASLRLVYRNDNFVYAEDAWCPPEKGRESGFSRPSLQRLADSSRLWIDSNGVVWSFPLMALDRHPVPELRHELGDYDVPGSGALDVEIVGDAGATTEILLFDGPGIGLMGRPDPTVSWSTVPRLALLDARIEGYVESFGSPNLVFDPSDCRVRVDFSAIDNESPSVVHGDPSLLSYQDLFVAEAVIPAD